MIHRNVILTFLFWSHLDTLDVFGNDFKFMWFIYFFDFNFFFTGICA